MNDEIQCSGVRAPCKSFLCHLILLDFLWTGEEGNIFDAFYVYQHFLAIVAAVNILVERICFYSLKISLQTVNSRQK